jgi:alanine dehydrogenase
LHLAPDRELTDALLASGVTAIAYETVTGADGGLPLLTPMSQVAGRMAPQVGAHALEKESGGRGVLLGGVPGVEPGEVIILGSGVVAANAALIAAGMEANVTVVGRNPNSLRRIEEHLSGRVRTAISSKNTIESLCKRADLVIGAALVPGAMAPKLVSADTVKSMQPGSVIVDVSIDQGGIAETSRPTSHSKPTYVVDDVVHYCVPNMPGAVARTSTFALNNATMPFVLALADKGWRQALTDDPHLRNGLHLHTGRVTCQAVAEAQGRSYSPAEVAMAA